MRQNYDELVLDAIRGHTVDRPQLLEGILEAVDARMKLVLSCEELSSSLERLIAAGQVGERPRHHFFESTGSGERAVYPGLSADEHTKACDRYRREFWRKYRELAKSRAV